MIDLVFWWTGAAIWSLGGAAAVLVALVFLGDHAIKQLGMFPLLVEFFFWRQRRNREKAKGKGRGASK